MNSLSKSFLLLFFNIIITSYSKKYTLNIEYLLSDDKEVFEVELYNRPKNPLFDFGEDIFYSGKIESMENFPVSKLVNYNETEFWEEKMNKKEKKEKKYEKKRTQNEKYKEKKMEKESPKEEEKEEKEKKIDEKNNDIKNQIDTDNSYEDFIEDPFFTFFYNAYDPFYKRLRYKNDNNNYYYKYDKNNIYNHDDNNNNYNKEHNNDSHNRYHNYNHNKYKNEDKYQYNNKQNQNEYNNQYKNYNNDKNNNNVHIIKELSDENGNTIKIIKIPKTNTYQTNYHYNTNNNNNYRNNYYNNHNRDPFSVLDDFDFNFDIDDPFKLIKSRLNDIYGIRFLSENNNRKKKISKFFSSQKHNLIFIPNNLYFDYIKYLPKSSIILIPRQYAKKLKNYEDYYIFTVDESIIIAFSKTLNNYYIVKLGQIFTDSNFVFTSVSLICFLCLIGSIIYSVISKTIDSYNILPIQKLSSKFPMFLCLINLLVYFSYICSYHETDSYYTIIKYICLFLYSLYKSIFLNLITLLLDGWMTLTFVEWAQKMNRTIPFLLYELITSMFFEIVGFYGILPYTKIQMYYFRNIFESIFISCMSLISLFRYYLPLRKKCKYLSIINSDFCSSYKLKKRKMITYIIFTLIYGVTSVYSNYFEFDIIYRYIQSDALHTVKQVLFESIFNFIFVIILLPMELPHLYTEETDLLSFGYFFTNLKEQDDILDINDKNIEEIKKEVENDENIPIVVVNPFYRSQNGFDELHTGKISIE